MGAPRFTRVIAPTRTSDDWLQPPPAQQGLKRYLETLRERIWLIVAAVVATTAIAIAYVATADRVYEADASILVSPVPDDAGTLTSIGLLTQSGDPLRAIETATTLVATRGAAERTAEALGGEADPSALLADVTVEPVAGSNIITLTARGSTPDEAARLANTFSQEAIEYRTELLSERIEEELPALQARTESLPPGEARDAVANQVAQLETISAGSDPTLQVVERAVPPSSPSSPRPMASVVAGMFAGLVLGVGGAFALQVLDPRLRREEQIRQRYRLPVLARIPRERSRTANPLPWGRLSPGAIEGYRTLRAVLAKPRGRSRAGRSRAGSVLVTSPGPSEGKTTSAMSLATSLALAGKQVILIEADLRGPSIGKALGIEVERGVISVLIEEATLSEALVSPDATNGNLRLLLAEQADVWGGELLSLPAATQLVDDAKQLADYVIVDSPPLATVVDALPVARTVDDVLVIVRLGASRLTRIQELAELLADTGIRPTGFVVVGTARGREAYYGDYRRAPGGSEARAAAKRPH